jgi:probable rRNA maturation factor
MTRLEVSFSNETRERLPRREIIATLKLILRRLELVGRVNMELIIVGDKKITELNHQYRHTDKPTDVLSFPETKSPHDNLIGSVVISADTAKRQAQQAGISTLEEVKVLAGHGLLHLLGYHHN